MKTDKQLFLVSVYQVNEEGVVVDATEPKWYVDTNEDRVKAQVLGKYLDKDEDWRVNIIQSYRFQ